MEHTKRKNDAHRTRLLPIVLGLALVILSAFTLHLLTRTADPTAPTGTLVYSLDGVTQAYTIQTHESMQIEPVFEAPATSSLISPDGLWRAVWQGTDHYYVLVIEDTRTQKVVQPLSRMTTADPSTTRLLWSPDSEWLIAAGNQRTEDVGDWHWNYRDTWVIHRTSGDFKWLGPDIITGDTAQFNPASTHIAYIEQYDRLHVMDLASRVGHLITNIGWGVSFNEQRDLVWSPDGQWIAYLADIPNAGLWAVRSDGSEFKRFVDSHSIYKLLEWRP
jgi:hypothetical protein